MYAAYRLSQELPLLSKSMRWDIQILEKCPDRLGGKIHTVRHSRQHSHVELGAMRILDSQKELLALLEELGLRTEPFIEENNDCPFVLFKSSSASHDGTSEPCLPLLSGRMGELTLLSLVEAGFVDRKVAMQAVEDVRAVADITNSKTGTGSQMELQHFTFPQILLAAFHYAQQQYDVHCNQKVTDYLADVSFPEGLAIRACASVVCDFREGKGGLHTETTVGEALKVMQLHSGKPVQIVGGFDTLIRALEQNCEAAREQTGGQVSVLIQKGCEVTRCTMERQTGSSRAVEVDYSSCSSSHRMAADAIIFTCPTLHTVVFRPSLPLQHVAAIESLRTDCALAMKGVLRFQNRFWEEHFSGGTSWVGPSPLNQVIFPGSSASSDGYLMLYVRGAPMKRLLKETDERIRAEMFVDIVEKLLPNYPVRSSIAKLEPDGTAEYKEAIYDEPGAYFLQGHADQIRESLKPVGVLAEGQPPVLFFSSVPRGWICEAVEDCKCMLDDVIAASKNKFVVA